MRVLVLVGRLVVFFAALLDFRTADFFVTLRADCFAAFFTAFLPAVFAVFRALPADRFGAARFLGRGAAAAGGTSIGSDTKPSPASGIESAARSSSFTGGCSAFSAWLAALVAVSAMPLTVSVNFSSIDLSLPMKPPGIACPRLTAADAASSRDETHSAS
ncbi:MAG TPA: hypothetical protein VGM09_28795 [Bradyrhizobium sp.]